MCERIKRVQNVGSKNRHTVTGVVNIEGKFGKI